MEKRLNSLAELSRFINTWGRTVKVGPTAKPIFRCHVEFAFKRRTLEGETICVIEREGYEGGQVKLDDSSVFTSDRVHLDFSADFQSYLVGEGDKLIISGSSAKMGDYSVAILPIEALRADEYYGFNRGD